MPTSISGTDGITFNDGTTQSTSAGPGFRNRIINGDMRIDQRSNGDSVSVPYSTTALIGSCDRWGALTGYHNGFQVAVQRVATTDTDFPFAWRIQRVAGQAATMSIIGGQAIESANCEGLAGKFVTLSLYLQAGADFSVFEKRIALGIGYGSGTDQALGSGFYGSWTNAGGASTSVQITTTRQRYSFTTLIPTNAKQIYVSFSSDYNGITQPAGANDWFQVTGVQLEEGPSATAFERRPAGAELALCQRYYEQTWVGNISSGGMRVAITGATTGSTSYSGGGAIVFTHEMRRIPSVTNYDSVGNRDRFSAFYNGAVSNNINPSVTRYTTTKSITFLEGVTATSAGRTLMCHYSANAEL
jgi:hypothetical protein